MAAEITHLCPPDGGGLMPCCGKTPFKVPRTDRITLDPALVTCPPPSAGFVRAYECGTSEPAARREVSKVNRQVRGGGSGI